MRALLQAEVDAAVAELLRLKTELAAAKGEPAPAAGKKEKAKQAKAAADAAKAEKAKQWEPKDKSKVGRAPASPACSHSCGCSAAQLKKKLQTLSQQEAFVNPTPPGDKKGELSCACARAHAHAHSWCALRPPRRHDHAHGGCVPPPGRGGGMERLVGGVGLL